jgi:hypothetical protein
LRRLHLRFLCSPPALFTSLTHLLIHTHSTLTPPSAHSKTTSPSGCSGNAPDTRACVASR